MARRADGVITCSHYMRGHVADVFGIDEAAVTVIPNGIDPEDLVAGRRPRRAAGALRRARRAARAAHRPARLREGLPGRARRAARRHRARSAACASSSPARGRTRPSSRRRPAPRPRRARHVPGLDRRRRAALALPDRRPLRGAVASTSRSGSWRSRRWRQRLPVHRRRHRRPARGRPQLRRRPALPRRATRARWRR